MVTVLLPDGKVLMHGTAPYDPKKAHAYYLRVRQLKGRKKGHGVDPKTADLAKRLSGKTDDQIRAEAAKSRDPAEKQLINTMLANRQKIHGKDGPKKVDPKVLAEQKKHAAARVASLRSELADLNQKLKDAVAKERKSKAKAKRGPTAAEKSKNARESKKYKDKHKQELSNKSRASSSKKHSSARSRASSVDSLKRRVTETQGKLHAAIQREKSLG
jgi:hypothetical protein